MCGVAEAIIKSQQRLALAAMSAIEKEALKKFREELAQSTLKGLPIPKPGPDLWEELEQMVLTNNPGTARWLAEAQGDKDREQRRARLRKVIRQQAIKCYLRQASAAHTLSVTNGYEVRVLTNCLLLMVGVVAASCAS